MSKLNTVEVITKQLLVKRLLVDKETLIDALAYVFGKTKVSIPYGEGKKIQEDLIKGAK